MLVVLGMAGLLKGQSSLDKTIVAQASASDTLIVTQLMGRVFPVVKGEYSPPGPISIGRTKDNDIAIAESSISKRHCFFTVIAWEIRITDCGSTNGTFVNGTRLEAKKAHRLTGGETLTLGRIALQVYRPQELLEYLRNQA
jgi:pSer/pThr/pTyr-binding forkhead associated (FHA) protein